MIKRLCTSKNLAKAMKDFYVYYQAREHASEDASPDSFKDPFERQIKGGLYLPPIKAFLGIQVDDNDEHQVFTFLEIARIGVIVDVVKAMNSQAGYITPALYVRPKNSQVNPRGGLTGLQRPGKNGPEAQEGDEKWVPIHLGRGYNLETHQKRIFGMVKDTTIAVIKKVVQGEEFIGL